MTRDDAFMLGQLFNRHEKSGRVGAWQELHTVCTRLRIGNARPTRHRAG